MAKEIKVDIKSEYDDRAANEAIADADKIEKLSPELEITGDASGLEDMADAAESMPGPLGQVKSLLSGPGGIAAGAAAGAAGLVALANAAADAAIDAKVTAELTGATVEDASRLQVIWKQSGADVNDLNDVLLQMNGALADSPELVEQLGINLDDGKNGVDRMIEVVGRLNALQIGVNEKAQIMSDLFGEEGVRQIQRVLVLFPELKTAMDEVSKKQVMTEKDVENAREFKGEMADLTAELTGLGTAIGKAVIPPFTEFIDMLNGGTEALDLYKMGMDVFDKAAAGFNKTQLEGLTTIEQVNAKVLELTDSQEIANRVVVQWKKDQDALNASLAAGSFGQFLHPPIATTAAITQGINNVFLPPGTPDVTADLSNNYIVRNSMRTGP
jgi:hypothetical protein